MKNILLITCILIFNLSFSQKDSNSLSKKIFYSNMEENQFQAKTLTVFKLEKIEKISLIKTIKTVNNSEGKFPLYKSEDLRLLNFEKSVDNESIITQNTTIKKNRKIIDFVDKVIVKISRDKSIDIDDFNNNMDYNEDQNVDSVETYATSVNKLIVAYQVNGESQLQIGNDIYRYVNKILKTEIDTTVSSSLNLLVLKI